MIEKKKSKSTTYFLIGIIMMLVPFIGIQVWNMYGNVTFTPEELDKYYMKNDQILVITPLLTANAYRDNGFYWYYNGTCDTKCLTIDIDRDTPWHFPGTERAVTRFEALGANMVTDFDLINNTKLLSLYHTIVVLHSEYVTQDIYDALQKHTNVFYMYPNALYAKVDVYRNPDRQSITDPTTGLVKYHPITGVARMTLVKGHNYPYEDVKNGFNWKYDNSAEEYKMCDKYEWRNITNGYQMTCWPQRILIDDHSIFGIIKGL